MASIAHKSPANTMEKALNAWRSVLGAPQVISEDQALAAAGTATFAVLHGPKAILRPGGQSEVRTCVRIAKQFKIPLYPVSRGKNWGLGSRVPAQSGCVVLDLGRMDRIIDYDEDLSYVSIEPGTTFQQVYDFLTANGSRQFLSVIGGSPDASIIGNTLERGDGIGPYGNRFEHVCGFEVVLPNADVINTGFSRFQSARAKHVSKLGVGPHLDGMFTQSSFGIVTRMTIWLNTKPEHFQLFRCEIADRDALPDLMDATRGLIQQRVIQPHSFNIWNHQKALARLIRYPQSVSSHAGELHVEPAVSEPWYACGALYAASSESGNAQQTDVTLALKPHVRSLEFLDQQTDADTLAKSMFLGIPSNANLKSLYWRKNAPATSDMDPDRDRCGVIWLCFVVPLRGCDVLEAVRMAGSLIEEHGFEPNIGMSCASPRCVHLFLAIIYDRDHPGHDQTAMECHDKVMSQLTEAGHNPNRLGIHSMDALPVVIDDSGSLLARLKQAFDPDGLLAPRRYPY